MAAHSRDERTGVRSRSGELARDGVAPFDDRTITSMVRVRSGKAALSWLHLFADGGTVLGGAVSRYQDRVFGVGIDEALEVFN
jgi:hypothetical protein